MPQDKQSSVSEPGETSRKDFPIFTLTQKGRRLSYLDSAATTQKPQVVIDRLSRFYSFENANIHRGAYSLSGAATEEYEAARLKVAQFLNASSERSIVFTKGTTDSINLIAQMLGRDLKKGDTILLSLLDHHSNIVPWQLIARDRGCTVNFIDITDQGSLDLSDFEIKLKTLKPKIVAITQMSNALGTLVPVGEVTRRAHEMGALVVIDGAQSVAHSVVDVQKIDCDFFAFSGHKLYGPTGIGVLYGKESLLEKLEPSEGGGGMISTVTTSGSTWTDLPQKFEAGTPPIAEALGLNAALSYLEKHGMSAVAAHESNLYHNALSLLKNEAHVEVYGPGVHGIVQGGIISFNINGVHPHDFATVADTFNVQIRAGHHCAMPLMKRLGLASTARASFGLYSTKEDIEALIEAIRFAKDRFL